MDDELSGQALTISQRNRKATCKWLFYRRDANMRPTERPNFSALERSAVPGYPFSAASFAPIGESKGTTCRLPQARQALYLVDMRHSE
jgi:hypothetical protein